MTLQLRSYQPADLAASVSMWRASKRGAFPYVAALQQHTLKEDTEYFRDVLAVRYEIWLAERDQQILGVLALGGGYIDQLFVAVGAQREGIGSQLVRKAKERSPTGLALFTFCKNAPARAFYEKHGFEIVRFGRSPPPENEPDVEYRWRPPPS